jgi:PAS domain S-box-containing protein/putative nucleotidyltransferase with HDIG domain
MGKILMQNKSGRNICILCAPVLIFAVLWVVFSILFSRQDTSVLLNRPILIGLVSSVLVTVIVSGFLYFLTLSKKLAQSIQTMQEIKAGKYQPAPISGALFPIVNQINQAIQDIANDQKQQLMDLSQRTAELDEKNTELNDAYMQMESSYGQLQAALEQLNESEQRYHSLVRNLPDIVLALDDLGNITYASRACNEILKFRRHDIVGKPFDFIICPDDSFCYNFSELKQSVRLNGELRLEIPLRKKDNTRIETEIKFTPVLESGRDNSIQAIIRDVTEQKRVESALIETNRRLEILNGFSHKLASTLELLEIYKTCVNAVTEKLGFYGCIYFMMEKNERFYRIMEYSGEYFQRKENLEQFSFIHRNMELLLNKEVDGILLNYNQVQQTLIIKRPWVGPQEKYREAYLQELSVGGQVEGLILVISRNSFLQEEVDILRSIGHTAAVAVENALLLVESKNNYVQTIDALIAAIEAKDQYTRGHSQRVSGLAVQIAKKMGMSRQQAEELRIAGILHDIGKIGISDSILQKKGPLTKEEYDEIKKHPAISNKILYPIGLSDRILKAIAFHHERFDGRGYPFGLTNESLGMEPQIIAVADAFDAMTSSRPYREPLSLVTAVKELENNKGTQFHPDIVDIMVQIQKESGFSGVD